MGPLKRPESFLKAPMSRVKKICFMCQHVQDPSSLSCSLQAPTTMKYDLLELIVVGVNKYACGCGYKMSTVGSYGI